MKKILDISEITSDSYEVDKEQLDSFNQLSITMSAAWLV
jgi:hypothetical protein